MEIHLILDEKSVESSQGLSFHLNSAVKHPANPLLLPGEPQQWDSLQVCWPGTVLYDAEERFFRCWYHGLDAVQADRPKDGQIPWIPGYAESEDGVHWVKPDLPYHMHRGRPTNRIGADWDGWLLHPVFPNPDTSDPERRFLSFWKDADSMNVPQMPRVLASSPDGKYWRREKVVYKEPAPRSMMQDFWQVIHQPEPDDPNFRYIAYSQYWSPRSWDDRLVRQIGLHHGPALDELQDALPPVVMAPEEGIDEELHFASVYKTGGNYLMLFESDRFSTKPLHGDLRLAVGADCQNFRRVHPHEAVVPTGGRGVWDENMQVTTCYGMQDVGDEVWIYYFGCPNVFTNWPGGYDQDGLKGSLFSPTYLGLATLPRDRFGYATGSGELLTHPLQTGPGTVWLNAEGEGMEIMALDASGKTVGQGKIGREVMQSVYRDIHWVGTPPAGKVQLKIRLVQPGKVYSVACTV